MVEITGPTAATVTDPNAPAIEALSENTTEATIEETLETMANPMAWDATAVAARRKLIAWSAAGLLVGISIVTVVLVRGDASEIKESPSSKVEEPESPKIETPKDPKEDPKVEETLAVETKIVVAQPDPVVSPIPSNAPSPQEPALSPPAEVKHEVEPPEPIASQLDEQENTSPKAFDPLEFDPEQLDLAQLQSGNDSLAPKLAEPKTTVAEVEQDSNLLETEVEPAAIGSQVVRVVAKPLPEEEQFQKDDWDIASRLALQLPKFSVRRMPLVAFLNLVAQMADVPISIEPKQLQMARISPQTEVSLDVTDLSLDAMLIHALKPLRLQHSVQDKQIILRCMLTETTGEKDFSVEDLVNRETTLEDLAGWVRQLIAPEQWQTAGGEGTLKVLPKSLRIHQSKSVQLQVLIFLEQLRLARGIPPRSRYPVEQLPRQAAYAVLADQLAVPTTFTFSQATPLDEVFRHWQRESKLVLLIDWPALAQVQLRPKTQIVCAIVQQPWQEALDQILDPLGLAWRAVSAEAIEITSVEKDHQQPQLQLYCLQPSAPKNNSDLPKKIRALLSKDSVDDSSAAANTVIYDPTGQVLAILAPAAGHRHIERWLSQQDGLLKK